MGTASTTHTFLSHLPDGSWGGWVPLHFSGKGRWVAGEEPKEVDLVDGVWCEVVYALDKQLRWIEKNFQPGKCRRACGRRSSR